MTFFVFELDVDSAELKQYAIYADEMSLSSEVIVRRTLTDYCMKITSIMTSIKPARYFRNGEVIF